MYYCSLIFFLIRLVRNYFFSRGDVGDQVGRSSKGSIAARGHTPIIYDTHLRAYLSPLRYLCRMKADPFYEVYSSIFYFGVNDTPSHNRYECLCILFRKGIARRHLMQSRLPWKTCRVAVQIIRFSQNMFRTDTLMISFALLMFQY